LQAHKASYQQSVTKVTDTAHYKLLNKSKWKYQYRLQITTGYYLIIIILSVLKSNDLGTRVRQLNTSVKRTATFNYLCYNKEHAGIEVYVELYKCSLLTLLSKLAASFARPSFKVEWPMRHYTIKTCTAPSMNHLPCICKYKTPVGGKYRTDFRYFIFGIQYFSVL